jgi:hypothetical protein
VPKVTVGEGTKQTTIASKAGTRSPTNHAQDKPMVGENKKLKTSSRIPKVGRRSTAIHPKFEKLIQKVVDFIKKELK